MPDLQSYSSVFWLSGVVLGLALSAGCRQPIESSPEAVRLPLAEADPAENGLQADCWPGWRGKNGSGIAPGGSPPISFSAGAGVRWKVDVPGRGNSSPVVWGDVVLLSSAVDTSDQASLLILCFRRSDGRLLWQAEAGKVTGHTHIKNGYASATVAADGRRIFAFFGGTGLFCYDFSGQLLWQADLGNLDHQYGTAASPVLYDDLVIQLCDSQDNSYLAAFDVEDGQQVWRTDRPSRGCWSTPVLLEAEIANKRRSELVVNGTSAADSDGRMIIAYDPNDGRQLWRVRGTKDLVTPTPLVSGGLVFCSSGRNGPTIAVRPGGSGDVTDTHVVWKTNRGGAYIPSGVAYRNRLFLVHDAGSVTCYNAGNGELIWKKRLRGKFTASLVAADGRIYATNERGTVYVFAAADAFELLAQNEMDARCCLATPAIAGGELFIRTGSQLFCIPGSAAAGGGKTTTADRRPAGVR